MEDVKLLNDVKMHTNVCVSVCVCVCCLFVNNWACGVAILMSNLNYSGSIDELKLIS